MNQGECYEVRARRDLPLSFMMHSATLKEGEYFKGEFVQWDSMQRNMEFIVRSAEGDLAGNIGQTAWVPHPAVYVEPWQRWVMLLKDDLGNYVLGYHGIMSTAVANHAMRKSDPKREPILAVYDDTAWKHQAYDTFEWNIGPLE